MGDVIRVVVVLLLLGFVCYGWVCGVGLEYLARLERLGESEPSLTEERKIVRTMRKHATYLFAWYTAGLTFCLVLLLIAQNTSTIVVV